MASSRLNSRVVTPKGTQLLHFPEWGDNNKDKSVMLRSQIFCKKEKKTDGKAVLFSTAAYLLSTSSTKCTDHEQYKGIYVFQLPASTPSPQQSTSAYPAGTTGSCLPRTPLVLLLLKSLNHAIQRTNFLICLLTKNLIQSCEVKYTEQHTNVNF